MDDLMVLFFILIMIPVYIIIIFMPYVTRKTESFGISIPEELYDRIDLKSMRKKYAKATGIISLLFTFLFLLLRFILGNGETTTVVLFSIVIVLYLLGSFLVYLNFHRQMKSLKRLENWHERKSQTVVMDTTFRDQQLTYSNLWFLASFGIILITVIITMQTYNQIPNKIPMQYNFSGIVTNWVEKSYRSVLIMPIMQVFLTLLFIFINILIGKAKQQISAENTEESIKQNITFRKRWSAFSIITGTALILTFTLIQLSFIYPIDPKIILYVPLVTSIGIVIASIILSFMTGQGGSRLKSTASMSGATIDRDDDQYWKLGQFYFNKNDPALFLEKRFGVGWTNNWARPLSWIILLGIIVLAAGIPILLTM